MNPLVYHIVSGHSFFTGIGLILLAVVVSFNRRAAVRRVFVVLFVVGVIGVVLSSTPIPYWVYGLATAMSLAWLLTRNRESMRRYTSWALVSVWLLAALVEVPWHVTPAVRSTAVGAMTVIGDSVSAGMEENEAETWPSLLARQRKIIVQDISHVGETASSALKRVQKNGIDASFVIVEIGGNDLLGSTRAPQFEADLDALLSHLKAEELEIVMFELPLLPFYHEFGRIQRSLSVRHDVRLIPKRVFLSILAEGNSTLDSIHLSQSGHQRMADLVWRISQSGVPE